MKIIYEGAVTSTMTVAAHALQTENPPFCVVAASQSQGRGRRGRLWSSPLGNLYLSIIYPWSKKFLHMAPFMVGLCVYDALRACHVPDSVMGLKWPNDILFIKKRRLFKVGGILIEALDDEKGFFLNIGIGLNTHATPSHVLYSTTHFAHEGYTINHTDFLKALHHALQPCMPFQKLGDPLFSFEDLWETVRHRWESVSVHQNTTLSMRIPSSSGDVLYFGHFLGVSPLGHLMLRDLEGNIKTFAVGDVLYE